MGLRLVAQVRLSCSGQGTRHEAHGSPVRQVVRRTYRKLVDDRILDKSANACYNVAMSEKKQVSPRVAHRRRIAGLALATAITAPITAPAVMDGLNGLAHAAGKSMDISAGRPDAATKARIEANMLSDKLKQQDANTICIPSKETMKFVFKVGQGELDAVMAIKGAGENDNNPCWDESVELVEGQIAPIRGGSNEPWPGDAIEIPVQMVHEQKK